MCQNYTLWIFREGLASFWGFAGYCLVLSLLQCSLTSVPKSSSWSRRAVAKAYCKPVLNTLHCIPTASWILRVSKPSMEYVSVPMAPTLVCSMFGFSGAVLVTQACDLFPGSGFSYNTSTTSNILPLAILNQIQNLLQHSKSKVCLCKG